MWWTFFSGCVTNTTTMTTITTRTIVIIIVHAHVRTFFRAMTVVIISVLITFVDKPRGVMAIKLQCQRKLYVSFYIVSADSSWRKRKTRPAIVITAIIR